MATNQLPFKPKFGLEVDDASTFKDDVVLKDKLSQSISTPFAVGATVNITTANGNTVPITGAGSITSFGTTVSPGETFKLIFGATTTLVHSANLICPSGENLIFEAGDWTFITALTASVWKVESPMRADGTVYFDNSLAYAIALG